MSADGEATDGNKSVAIPVLLMMEGVFAALVYLVLLLLLKPMFRNWPSGRVASKEPAPLTSFVRRLGPGTRCPVCRGVLEGDLISCPSCATPQHRDCWTYVRGCSTYGCRRSA
jgi:hypothetical protein